VQQSHKIIDIRRLSRPPPFYLWFHAHCTIDSALLYIMVARNRNTIWPPPPQLSLHRRAALRTNSTQSARKGKRRGDGLDTILMSKHKVRDSPDDICARWMDSSNHAKYTVIAFLTRPASINTRIPINILQMRAGSTHADPNLAPFWKMIIKFVNNITQNFVSFSYQKTYHVLGNSDSNINKGIRRH
jgi:hypothetical protein